MDELVNRLKTVATATNSGSKPIPQKSIEFRHDEEIFLEVFCNPNIWATPFAAKVLLTVRDRNIRLSTEAELSQIIEDINQYLN